MTGDDSREPREIGADGQPVDCSDPWHKGDSSIEESRRAFFDSSLRRYKAAWLDGNTAALSSAVELCSEHDRPLPDWTAEGVQSLIAASYKNPSSGKRGRLANPAATDRQNRIHYMRWDAVRELRDRKEELAASGYTPTWEAAYVNASEVLAKTEAFGSPDAIKKSYQLVNRLFKSGKGAKFYQTDRVGKK